MLQIWFHHNEMEIYLSCRKKDGTHVSMRFHTGSFVKCKEVNDGRYLSQVSLGRDLCAALDNEG